MRNATRYYWALALVVVAIALVGWLATSASGLYDRLAAHSVPLAVGLVTLLVVSACAAAFAAARMFHKLGKPESQPAKAPEDVVKAAELQAEKAEQVLALVKD